MKSALAVSFAVFAASVCQGGSAEKTLLAAMKLSEQPNYSWSTTVIDDAGTYDIEGQTEQGGWTRLRLPMLTSIRRRLGRQADYDIDAVFKGTTSCAIRTDRGWQTIPELPPQGWLEDDFYEFQPAGPHNNGGYFGSGGTIGTLDPADPFFALPPSPPRRTESAPPYSNAQLAVSPPHSELAVIVSTYTDLKVDGNVATGTLSDTGAQLLLVRDGQDHLNPLAAAGTFKLLVKDGVVVKYLLRLEGVLRVDGKKKVLVHQLSCTTVKSIGRTRVEIPEEARRKLEP